MPAEAVVNLAGAQSVSLGSRVSSTMALATELNKLAHFIVAKVTTEPGPTPTLNKENTPIHIVSGMKGIYDILVELQDSLLKIDNSL